MTEFNIVTLPRRDMEPQPLYSDAVYFENMSYWYGKKRTKEVVEKCAASHRKPIICIETGEIFPSITAAAKAKNISGKSNISNALNGRSKTAGKLHWRYYNESKETEVIL